VATPVSFSISTTFRTRWRSKGRLITFCTSPRRQARWITCANPIPTLKVGSLGTHNTLGLAKLKQARYPPGEHQRGLRATPSSTRSARTTGATSTRSESAASTTRPKRFAEAMTMGLPPLPRGEYAHRSHLQHVRGRACGWDDGRVVPNFMGPGATRRTDHGLRRRPPRRVAFCYVDDLVEGITRLLFADFHEPVNLGNPNEVSIPRLRPRDPRPLGQHERSRLPAAAARRPRACASPTYRGRGASSVGKPKVARREGLRKTLEYFQMKE